MWGYATILGIAFALAVCFFRSIRVLEFQELGLNYNFLTETIENRTYCCGRYYLGLYNHFHRFPRVVNTMYFGSAALAGVAVRGPQLRSRTKDGLTVFLEVSLQFKLKFDGIYDLYQSFGKDYQPILLRMAMEQLSIAATEHEAQAFFTNRTGLATQMHLRVDSHFRAHGFSEVPFLQLITVNLPTAFEDAIQDTQVKEQEIKVARALQESQRVAYKTSLVQARQFVKVLHQQAEGQMFDINAQNEAYCRQYALTQRLQSKALIDIAKGVNWNTSQVLEWLKIRAVREHPSEHTSVWL